MIFHQIFFQPQMKGSTLKSNKDCIYELPNDLKHRILEDHEISGRSQNFIELYLSVKPDSQNENFVNINKKMLKIKLDFSSSTLFYMKTRVCLKDFVHDFF